MRPNCFVMVLGLSLALSAMAQDNALRSRVSSESLTKEQVAVYHAVLQDYQKDFADTLNLANTTEPLEQSAAFFDGGCPKTSSPRVTKALTSVVHHLDPAVTVNLKFAFVDPSRQEEKIKKGDPAILMKRVIDDRENVPPQQMDDAVKQAFKNGLFTLSEIVFNKKNTRALVSYSFVCGELCGHGEVLVFKKVGEKWKVHKTCQDWVS